MKRLVVLFLCLGLVTPAFAGLGSNKTMYVGGTVGTIKAGTEGVGTTDNEKVYVFSHSGQKLEIPYDRVDGIEYGQKAGRRLGLALTISPWLLLSKKRKHFLTISWKDAQDKQQAAVLEVGKDMIRVQLATLEARTG